EPRQRLQRVLLLRLFRRLFCRSLLLVLSTAGRLLRHATGPRTAWHHLGERQRGREPEGADGEGAEGAELHAGSLQSSEKVWGRYRQGEGASRSDSCGKVGVTAPRAPPGLRRAPSGAGKPPCGRAHRCVGSR